ncbi:hypothetical protein ACHAWF_005626, partial [Thalassiosira exigua]
KRYKRKTIRNAVACLVALPGDALLWIVNTHLGCHFTGMEQHQQARELVAFVESLERSSKICGVILSGDFNSPPLFPCIRTILRSGLSDVRHSFASRGERFGGTFPSHTRVIGMPSCLKLRKLIRLDYIFLHESADGIVCKHTYVQDDGSYCSLASDHLPVCAVFYLGRLC